MKTNNTNKVDDLSEKERWLELVQKQVDSLRFGVVQIVVHDSRVVQIEKTEKLRIEQKEN
ncbi:YezD family protein [Pedosphaera parvula]|nr:YezD family protein [Pedosphaera parvula]